MMFVIVLLAVLGFGISLYTYITEQKVKLNPEYKPVCDLSDRISCSKPMKSQYANIFFLSNAAGYALAGTLGAILPATGDKYFRPNIPSNKKVAKGNNGINRRFIGRFIG